MGCTGRDGRVDPCVASVARQGLVAGVAFQHVDDGEALVLAHDRGGLRILVVEAHDEAAAVRADGLVLRRRRSDLLEAGGIPALAAQLEAIGTSCE